jgi:hypothetical protein
MPRAKEDSKRKKDKKHKREKKDKRRDEPKLERIVIERLSLGVALDRENVAASRSILQRQISALDAHIRTLQAHAQQIAPLSSGPGPRKKSEESEAPEEEGTEAPLQSSFWATMEDYFRHLNDNDLRALQPQPLHPNDPAFEIPPLGPSFFDDDDDRPKKKQRRDFKPEKEGELYVGEFTQRVLSAMLEENIYVDTQRLKFELEDEGAPMLNYSTEHYIGLEERVRIELSMLGLLEEEPNQTQNDRMDDEICAELRRLHQSLREQVEVNNQHRMSFAPLVSSRVAQQENEKRQRAEAKRIEKLYIALVKRKKKRLAK